MDFPFRLFPALFLFGLTYAVCEPLSPEALFEDKVSEHLGKPDQLEAHLYGKLYYGWSVSNMTPEKRLEQTYRERDSLLWAAMRFVGDKVEIQFVDTQGKRTILTGTNPIEGLLELSDSNGDPWVFSKALLEDTILWIGSSNLPDSETVFIHRPRNEHYLAFEEEMRALAPEAFLWVYNVWGEPFHRERFPYLYGDSLTATITAMGIKDDGVHSVSMEYESGKTETFVFNPPRPRNRIPVAIGYPVNVSHDDGGIAHIGIDLTPVSWRECQPNTLELLLVETSQADITFDEETFTPSISPKILQTLTKIPVVPDFAIIDFDVFAEWFVRDDIIAWAIGDGAPGMLELESIPLTESQNNPWRPIAEPHDIITNQLRVLNVNATGGWDRFLPLPAD